MFFSIDLLIRIFTLWTLLTFFDGLMSRFHTCWILMILFLSINREVYCGYFHILMILVIVVNQKFALNLNPIYIENSGLFGGVFLPTSKVCQWELHWLSLFSRHLSFSLELWQFCLSRPRSEQLFQSLSLWFWGRLGTCWIISRNCQLL